MVVTNQETGESHWLKKSKFITTEGWDTYLLNMTSVALLNDEDLCYSAPEESAEKISLKRNCFRPEEMKGNWLKIVQFEDCDDPSGREEEPVWIKWKNEKNELLIYYFTTH